MKLMLPHCSGDVSNVALSWVSTDKFEIPPTDWIVFWFSSTSRNKSSRFSVK